MNDILSIIDPEGLQERRQNRLKRRQYINSGPNHVLHIDKHDKLSPFGFCIHAAMDGFSRRVVWLPVGNTNSDPGTMAHSYLDNIDGVPVRLRVDKGTENTTTLDYHALL